MNIKMDIIDADIRILIFCFSFKIVKNIKLQKVQRICLAPYQTLN